MKALEERIRYLEQVHLFTLEALETAVTLGDAQQNLGAEDSLDRILEHTLARVRGILECEAMAVFLVDEATSDFVLARSAPPEWGERLDSEASAQVDRGNFARALNVTEPLFVRTLTEPCAGRQALFHVLATGSRIRGMFMGLPRQGARGTSDASLRLLSLLLLNAANCLESRELYGMVRAANKELRGKVLDLERQSAFYHQLFENSPLALVLVDPDDVVLEVNEGYERLFGHARADIVGRMNHEIIVPPDMPHLLLKDVLERGVPVMEENERLHASGRRLPVSVLAYPVFVGNNMEAVYFSYQDISERKAYEEQLTHQAFHDQLTGLPNRALFLDRLTRCISRARRNDGYRFAVLMIDLDRFKTINDSLGHLMGDLLLKEVGERFSDCLRSMDTVARLGGDEFAVLLEEFTHPSEVLRVVQRMRATLAEPFDLNGHKAFTDASFGVVIRTQGYRTAETLLRDADLAMYRAKAGGEDFRVFNRSMYRETVRVMTLETELRQALKNGDLYLRFQPVVDLAEGGLAGFEALARWNHPERGEILPREFIPVAEETGLIHPLGEWVLSEACERLRQWEVQGVVGGHVFMSVNLSALQLSQRGLPATIEGALRCAGVNAGKLKLEITETAVMQNVRATQRLLERLKAVGLEILVDDFGTGYSSLASLQSFPLDYLKIDRSFISGNGRKRLNRGIVATILALAENMGLKTIAEGVEYPEQYRLLQGLSCDLAQGYLVSRPLDADTAARFQGFELGQKLVSEAGPPFTH